LILKQTLLKNPTFDLLILMQIFEAFIMSGFTNFLPKIMENFFDYSTSMASMITGWIRGSNIKATSTPFVDFQARLLFPEAFSE